MDHNVLEANIEILKNEKEFEIKRKDSLENRTNFILAIAIVLLMYIYETISLKYIIILLEEELTFSKLIKIISGIGIYVSIFTSFNLLFKNLDISKYKSYDVDSILCPENILDSQILLPKEDNYLTTIKSYQVIIRSYKEGNSIKAERLTSILKVIQLNILLILIFICVS